MGAPQDRIPLRAVIRAPQMVEQLGEAPLVSPSDCALVPQMGSELVVEVPKIVSHPMCSAVFVERSSSFPPETGSAFRGAEHQGHRGFLPALSSDCVSWSRTFRSSRRYPVQQRLVEVLKIFLQDSVTRRLVGVLKIFLRDRVQRQLVVVEHIACSLTWQSGRILIVRGGLVGQLSPFGVLPCRQVLGCLLLTKQGVLNLLRSSGFWEVYDDRLQFRAVLDAPRLDDASSGKAVSDAWMIWSSAAESALADAFCLAGARLVLGEGTTQFRVVRLGGLEVRKARNNVADPLDGGDVFMCRNSSIAPMFQGCIGRS